MTHARRTLIIAAVLTTIVAAVLISRVTRATPHVRDAVVTALNERFQSEIALDELQVSVFPRPEVSGSGLTVRLDGRSDVPPLVHLGTFQASASLLGVLGTPVHIRTVELDRLEIHIPAGGVAGLAGKSPASSAAPAAPAESAAAAREQPRGRPGTKLTIDEIVAGTAQLQIASKDPQKLPRLFDIHDLHILGFGEQDGAEFHARVINPVPKGLVDTTGRFGPWQPREPRTTPLHGEYTFTDANMNTIKGLGGTLSSRGAYSGVLERIEVAGVTDIPDFSIDIAGQAVPLTTTFRATVDGTNGNTYLEQVDAKLFESHIHAKGAVERTQDVKGRRVALDIAIDQARIEDLLKLAVKTAKPPLTGAVKITTKLDLPAGDDDVIRRLRLDGEFVLDQARFTNFDVQKRINTLSRKGKGDDSDDGPSVVSKLRGRFVLRNAALNFSNLTFAVPGAIVQIVGTYDLQSEALDFKGNLLLDASLRETTSGVKAVLATLAQPFFRRKGGGSNIPIRIGGTRGKPEFGLDVKRALLPG